MSEVLRAHSPLGQDSPHPHWHWGYGIEEFIASGEPHHWNCGVLFGFWLAPPSEFEHAAAEFEAVLAALEKHDEISRVRVAGYSVDAVLYAEIGGGEVPASGEKWVIHFSREVEYDHRD